MLLQVLCDLFHLWSYSLKDFIPTMAVEAALLSHIQDGEGREEALRQHLTEVQASNVLNKMYCARLHDQLVNHKKKGKKGGKGRWIKLLLIRGCVLQKGGGV
jgi:hypothetical protein